MCFFVGLLLMFIGIVIYLDPFLHYHSPINGFFYELNNERYQNYGIVSNMEYDAIITGTSLTENFRTSQFNDLFDATTVKVPFSGATYYETKQLLERAFSSKNQIKYVLRTVDVNHLIEDISNTRTDLGVIPEYLYNDRFWDDYQYWLNKDVLLNYIIPMLDSKMKHKESGFTNFDDYASWRGGSVLDISNWDIEIVNDCFEQQSLSDKEYELLVSNVKNNILEPVKKHPETTFLFYIPPYPTVWWFLRCQEGNLKKYYEAQRYLYETIGNYKNVKIYCYSNEIDLVSNWNNYVDEIHYNDTINDQILEWISKDYRLLTNENYNALLDNQYEIYSHFDYELNAKQRTNY